MTDFPTTPSFHCLICHMLPLNTQQTSCDHFFCGPCLDVFWKSSSGGSHCPECGKSVKRSRCNPTYELKLREAFPEEYAKRDSEDVKHPEKMDVSQVIGYLTNSMMALSHARSNLFSKVRSGNIKEQAQKFFGITEELTLIEADCPWDYPNQFWNGSTKGKYRGMKDEELYALPVEGLCAPNAALFFWTTFPKLDIAINCLYSWGFEYTTCFFAWMKLRPRNDDIFEMGDIFTGSGSYTRNNVEICLLGLRGDISKFRLRNTYIPNAVLEVPERNPLLQEDGVTIPKTVSRARLFGHHESTDDRYFAHLEASSLFSVIGDHSEKPEETYEKIIAVFGDLPRAILFAREKRAGWFCFGDQVGKFHPRQIIDADLEQKWKKRQKKNADFANWMIKSLDNLWDNRESAEVEMQPRK